MTNIKWLLEKMISIQQYIVTQLKFVKLDNPDIDSKRFGEREGSIPLLVSLHNHYSLVLNGR